MGPRDAILGLLLLGAAGCVAGEAPSAMTGRRETAPSSGPVVTATAAREALRPTKSPRGENRTSAKRERRSLDDRVSLNAPASGRNALWRSFQYPVPPTRIDGVDLYRIDQDEDSGLYVVQTGLLISAPEGTLVRYHRDMFAIGDAIKETRVLAAGDAGPDGFPEFGRYVRLRHTLEAAIPGMGNHFDTVYAHLLFRDASASTVGSIIPDDAPDGGVLLGGVGKTGKAAKPGLRFMILPGTTPEAPPAASYGTPLSPYGLLAAVERRAGREK